MQHALRLESARIYQSAFRAEPEVAAEAPQNPGFGIYGWTTPPMEGFALPETDSLIIALHLGGSRCVRAVTGEGLSRSYSAPGLLTVLPAGQPAAFRTGGGISLVTLHVPNVSVKTPSLLNNSTPNFAFRDSFLSTGMDALLRAARCGTMIQPDYLLKVSESLVSHLSRWTTTEQPFSPAALASDRCLGRMRLDQLLAFIERELCNKVCLDELARMTGLSRATFTRSFKLAVGLSPHQYLNLRRVEAAKRMMRNSGVDLTYIAHETGFSSQSHFTEVFRSLAGCTPAKFRRTA